MKIVIDIPERDYDLAYKCPNALIATYAHYIKEGIPYKERPKGVWIEVTRRISDNETATHWECSKCHNFDYRWGVAEFCSFCGADMRKGGRKMSNLEKAKTIIKENFKEGDCGLFNTRNFGGDAMDTIYKEEGLQIGICEHWSYFEVFGLSDSEFDELLAYYNHLKEAENE